LHSNSRAYQGGEAAEGEICPGPQNLENKKNIDISNGLRKKFLNLNFANIGPKKDFTNVI
jgi:hypothetical protein